MVCFGNPRSSYWSTGFQPIPGGVTVGFDLHLAVVEFLSNCGIAFF